MKIKNALLMLGFAIMFSISQNVCAAFVQPYSTVIRNVGTKKFSDSLMLFNKRKITGGWVSPGKHTINLNPSVPIPDKAIVSWQREDGTVYEKQIEIKSKLSKLVNKQEYYLIVDIDDNNNVNLTVVVCNPGEYWANKISKSVKHISNKEDAPDQKPVR